MKKVSKGEKPKSQRVNESKHLDTLCLQSGQALILATIVLLLIMINTMLIISGSLNLSNSTKYTTNEAKAINLAEAGVDKAVATLNATGGSNYNGEPETTVGDGSYTVTVTSKDASTNILTATGYIPNKTNPKTKKTVQIQVSKGSGVSFSYGIQVGDGGFDISGGSTVNGSVYSNGNISLTGSGRITGDAYVAGGTQPSPDQPPSPGDDCVNPNCADFLFGKNVGGTNQMDIAQSFTPSSTTVINRVQLMLKRFGAGNLNNALVKITTNNAGKPNKNGVLTSGTLASSQVTTNYGMIDVTFSSNPTLTAGTLYWIVIDTTTVDNTNYWAWKRNTLGGYSGGSPSWSPDMGAGNPTWNTLTGDLVFYTYMGGVATKIYGSSGTINGNAYANTLDSATWLGALSVGKDAFYQTQNTYIQVSGQSCNNNTHCHPNSTDPAPLTFPVSQANIDAWKDEADNATQSGNVTLGQPCTTNLEKKKYTGNVTVNGGCTLTTDSPVWIVGNLTVSNGSTLKLKPSFGSGSGVIIVDGQVTLDGGSRLQGTGDASGLSYLMVLSTYNSPTLNAITVNGGNSSSIVYAPYGIINLSGGTNLREVTAKKLVMTGGAQVTYETGVANPFFTSGPSGSFSAIKGTYQVK